MIQSGARICHIYAKYCQCMEFSQSHSLGRRTFILPWEGHTRQYCIGNEWQNFRFMRVCTFLNIGLQLLASGLQFPEKRRLFMCFLRKAQVLFMITMSFWVITKYRSFLRKTNEMVHTKYAIWCAIFELKYLTTILSSSPQSSINFFFHKHQKKLEKTGFFF